MDFADLGPAMTESAHQNKERELERKLEAISLRVRRLEELMARLIPDKSADI